jgi:hypothetical protein
MEAKPNLPLVQSRLASSSKTTTLAATTTMFIGLITTAADKVFTKTAETATALI